MASLARLTNVVQQALASGQYIGAIWLEEGAHFVEETSYWFNLLIDTAGAHRGQRLAACAWGSQQ